ncbi:MAG TPA: DUF305 domain-containing protein [Gemmatimonadaceae bacterium]|nr:DUF305 domain-containing protein [Gemmatimonadaceae bacterium]
MRARISGAFPAVIAAALVATACKGGTSDQTKSSATASPAGGAMGMGSMATNPIPADADYTLADVQFMQGMITHHAQALVMTAEAPTHGANPSLGTLCKRMYMAQSNEIALMQNWLKDRSQPVTDPNDPHPMMMPGMLTPQQIAQLGASKGATWDSLFLIGMIQHHEGALKMVADLFASPGGGQGADIFAFATGIDAGQRVEISIMQHMLNPAATGSPNQ